MNSLLTKQKQIRCFFKYRNIILFICNFNRVFGIFTVKNGNFKNKFL